MGKNTSLTPTCGNNLMCNTKKSPPEPQKWQQQTQRDSLHHRELAIFPLLIYDSSGDGDDVSNVRVRDEKRC